MADFIRSELREEGDDVVLSRFFDDGPLFEDSYRKRQENGRGLIYENGSLVGRRLASIPLVEAGALEAAGDADWLEFKHDNSRAAFARLIVRFPHWCICDGGVGVVN